MAAAIDRRRVRPEGPSPLLPAPDAVVCLFPGEGAGRVSRPEMGGTIMDGMRDLGVPSTLDLVQRSINALVQKRRLEGLKPVDELRYRNLCELQERLLDRQAS